MGGAAGERMLTGMPRDRLLDAERDDSETRSRTASGEELEAVRSRAGEELEAVPAPSPPASEATRHQRRHPWRRLAETAGVLVVIAASVGAGAWQSATLRAGFDRVIGAGMTRPRFANEAPPPLAAAEPAASPARARPGQSLAVQADNAARELAGSGDRSSVSWNPESGLWPEAARVQTSAKEGAGVSWQSAQALRALVRYLQQTRDTQPAYQDLIARTYLATVPPRRGDATGRRAVPPARDAVWWGMAWVQAARYELYDRHDRVAAARYLTAAQGDAAGVAEQPHACPGAGVSSRPSGPPQTLVGAAFVELAAQLGALRDARGRLSAPRQGRRWLRDGGLTLSWLRSSGLADSATGQTYAVLTAACQPAGRASTATQGMLAEALVTLGAATHSVGDLNWAASLINYALTPASGLVGRDVLQEPCEDEPGLCTDSPGGYALSADKGLLTDAMADWTRATGSSAYAGFVGDQAHAVLTNAAGDGRTVTRCRTPTGCQLGFYWSRRPDPAVAQLAPTPASQAAGLSALSDALSVSRTPAG